GYFDQFKEIGARLGPFDLAAVAIGAYVPAAIMRSVHLTPEQAVRAAGGGGGRGSPRDAGHPLGDVRSRRRAARRAARADARGDRAPGHRTRARLDPEDRRDTPLVGPRLVG